MVKYLVSQVSTNVNQRLKLIDMFGPDVECTVALIALYNQDAEMLRLLCKDLGAIVDEKIWIDGELRSYHGLVPVDYYRHYELLNAEQRHYHYYLPNLGQHILLLSQPCNPLCW